MSARNSKDKTCPAAGLASYDFLVLFLFTQNQDGTESGSARFLEKCPPILEGGEKIIILV